MKPRRTPFVVKMAVLCSFVFLFGFSQSAYAGNIISGFVYDKFRNPLPDIDVELLDDLYRTILRQKTDSIGRYQFSQFPNGTPLPDGNYNVKVLAFRYDLVDQTHYVEIKSVSSVPGQPGSSYVTQDFYLEPKKGGLRELEFTMVFAQDIPRPAEAAYKKALNDLANKRPDEGFLGLQEAIRIFPAYYNALNRFGRELLLRKQYLDAAQAFLRAGAVNPKSAISYYWAGSALAMLDERYNKSALSALTIALEMAPASVQVLVLMGSIEREMGKFAEAEKHLQLAKKLSPTRIPELQMELSQLYANDLKKYKEAADELEIYIKASKLSDKDEAKTKQIIADLRQKATKQFSN